MFENKNQIKRVKPKQMKTFKSIAMTALLLVSEVQPDAHDRNFSFTL